MTASRNILPPRRFWTAIDVQFASEITIDRIELVTLEENMRRNSYHNRYPKEIGLAIQARGALVRKINRRKQANEKQD